MEEIGNTEAIQKEILEEARKAAEKILRDAAEVVDATASQAKEKARSAKDTVANAADSWIARNRTEMLARIPLEKIRYRTALVDGRVRKALAEWFATLGEERTAGLLEEHMKGSAGQFRGKEVKLLYRGLSKPRAIAAAKSALGIADPREVIEDKKLPATGLVIYSVDGKLTLRATIDLVESDLLDRQRGELAGALCAEALKE